MPPAPPSSSLHLLHTPQASALVFATASSLVVDLTSLGIPGVQWRGLSVDALALCYCLTRLCETLLVIGAYKRISTLAQRDERERVALLVGLTDRVLVTFASLSPLLLLGGGAT